MKLLEHAAMLIALMLVVVALILNNIHRMGEHFRDRVSQINPGYLKELQLFRSLSATDQAAYLEMSADDKLDSYRRSLE